MADTKLAKVGITIKEPWRVDVSYEMLDFTLWRVQDGGDGCGYIAKRDNIGVVPNSDDSVWIPASQAGQSIYDLAVKYGHFEGTEEEFEAEYQAVLQAARDAASETRATNAEIQEAEELRKTAENTRVENETARQTAETGRQTAETARETAETARETAETQRGENETTRQSQETARESSETQRQSNEATRQSNETARESAELERTADFEGLKTDMQTAIQQADEATAEAVALNNQVAGDESARQTAESGRVAAETQRQSNETQRGTNEQTRQTQETARQTAEQTRQTQEGTRQTQETARQTAEGNRASAESQRVSNETARQTAETAREEQATTDHQRAEEDHAIAEEDHATLDEKISHKADIDGSYDGMAVGIARNLEGRTDVTDSFFERTTGGDAEVANGTAQLNEVKGKSQVWNQQVKNGNFANDTDWNPENGRSMSISNGVCSVSVISSPTAAMGVLSAYNTELSVILGHKYLVSYEGKVNTQGSEIKASFTLLQSRNSGEVYDTLTNYWARYSHIISPTANVTKLRANIRIKDSVIGGIADIKNVFCIDLTLLGIDNLETVDEVEAWLAENIGEQAYYPYNAGTVLNNRMTGVESIGFNLLDPVTGKADIIGAYSDVYGNYYGITGTHGALTFTDKFGNTETITPDEDGKFLLEKAGELSVADAGEDCAVFLWWDGTQTEYKPYEKNVGALDVTHIYGKLNGEGNYVRVWPTGMPGIGDIKDSLKVVDGQVVAERKVGEVDLGKVTWSDISGIFYKPMLDANYVANNSVNMACGSVLVVPFNNRNFAGPIFTFDGTSNRNLQARNFDYSSASDFKTAITGTLLYYELATPQVYTDLIYRDSEAFADGTPVTLPVNYKVDNWGIERIVPQNTEEAVVTAKPELTMRYSIDAVETMNTHSDQIEDLYEKNEELDQRKPEKYGEYPDMAVGSAKTLAGNDTKVEDFFFKALDCADGLAELNSARGNSLVWNQIIPNGDLSDGNTGWNAVNANLSISNGEAVFVPTAANGGASVRFDERTLDSSHKYLLSFFAKVSEDGNLMIYCGQNFVASGIAVGTNTSKKSVFFTGKLGVYIWFRGSLDKAYTVSDVMLIDLTLMFGSGNEPATVEEFEAMFPLPYYDYNAGEIISNKTEEVKVTGFNQWDEEWEGGYLNAGGEPIPNNSKIRSANYIAVLPGSSYFIKAPSMYGIRGYDAAENFTSIIGASNNIFTVPEGTYYVKFFINDLNTYNHDICINLSDPARNGEYEPYKTNSIGLNLPTLTGKLNGEGESVVVFPDGLKSAGSVYDEIVGDKAIKRVGVVDLGDLNWSTAATGTSGGGALRMTTAMASAKVGVGTSVSNIVCGNYVADTPDNVYNANSDKLVAFLTSSGGIQILDKSYSDGNIFKTAMSGVLLYYELATPEEYILDAPLPDTFQAYKGGTIKQLPENGSVPVTAPCILTATYAIDAVSALVGLPRNYVSKESLQAMLNAMQSAGIIASYTMTYNENTGKYDFTFVAPTNS